MEGRIFSSRLNGVRANPRYNRFHPSNAIIVQGTELIIFTVEHRKHVQHVEEAQE